MSRTLQLPCHNEAVWPIITNALCNKQWTPTNLIKAIDEIRTATYKNVKEMPTDKRFSGLLKFLGEPCHATGNPNQFWGEYNFNNQFIDSYIGGWFLGHTVPYIVNLILELQDTFPEEIPLLSYNPDVAEQSLSLSKKQAASLLACSFFCSFASQCAFKLGLNFDGIYFSLNKSIKNNQNTAKLCMIMNYFERCRTGQCHQDEPIIIKRLYGMKYLNKNNWCFSEAKLSNFTVNETGSINDAGAEALHVDFANKWIGGGVLRRGAVQEEIMFSIAPELLTTIIVCDVMGDREAIVISGAECFNLHTGYSRSFQFMGNCVGSPECRVAIDATRFTGIQRKQYTDDYILRELNKAYVGFNHGYPTAGAAVATGNWGCGAFGGHIQLKSMLQWMSASECGRPVIYYTFGDENCQGMADVTKLLLEKEVTVYQLANAIFDFCNQIEPRDKPEKDLYIHLKDSFYD